ncbi:hypothetical protein ACFPRL_27280 [Pseudoclavibacter helvolus]
MRLSRPQLLCQPVIRSQVGSRTDEVREHKVAGAGSQVADDQRVENAHVRD